MENIIKELKENLQSLLENFDSNIELPDLMGKLFEIYTLVDLLQNFENKYEYEAINPSNDNSFFKLPKKPCIPNKEKFSYIKMKRKRRNPNIEEEIYEIWMNIEFIGISEEIYKGHFRNEDLSREDLRRNFCHELDIAIIKNSNNSRPTYKEIYVAVECKDVKEFTKSILKQVIGIRRELSFFGNRKRYNKNEITTEKLRSFPPSEFYIYSTNPKVETLDKVGEVWDLKFKCLSMSSDTSTNENE